MRAIFIGVAVGFGSLCGCTATQTSEQYFIAVEPSNKQAAVYKVRADLTGWGGVVYKLNHGYVPVNVIDALSGKVGEPPDLFAEQSSSQNRAGLNEELEKRRKAAILGIADAGAGPGGDQQIDEMTRFFGSLKMSANLTDNEQISIGQTGSTDPYGYRKLVFYVSTDVIKLSQFETELNDLDRASSDLAKVIIENKRVAAEQTKARLAERKKLRTGILRQIQTTAVGDKADMTKWTAMDFLNVFAAAGGLDQ